MNKTMAKKVKSVWDKIDTEKEPDVYKIIKNVTFYDLLNFVPKLYFWITVL